MIGKLKKYSWAIGLAVIAALSLVSALATNRFIARKLAPPEKVEGLPPPRAGAAPPARPEPVAQQDSAPEVPHPEPAPAAGTGEPPPSSEGLEATQAGLMDYEVILIRNIFDSANSLHWPESEPGGEPTAPGETREPLNVRLYGTVVASPAQFSWAILSRNDASAAQETFRIGESIYGQGTLSAVLRNKIVVALPDGGEQTVELYTGQDTAASSPTPVAAATDKPGLGDSIRKVGENKYEVDAREIQSAMDNMDKLATSARIVPSFENGNPVGFKVFRIKPDSFYNKLGIRNGDVISKINGFEINSTEKALQIYQMLRTEKSITLDLTRRGQKMTMEYSIR